MRIPCAACRNPTARVRLHRVGHRLLCPPCLTALNRRKAGDGPPLIPLSEEDRRFQRRLGAALAGSGLVAKGIMYVLLFLWAAKDPTGAAALQGVVAADILTWLVLSLLEWQQRGFQVKAGAIFELGLVIVYLNRGALLDITTDAESTGIQLIFFLLFAVVKTGLWGAEHVLETTGVRERE